MPGAFDRDDALRRLADTQFDVLVIGGGVTGAGTALDAASRGLRTALVERDDFASGTSSKSSKLVHGGLRYLQQGDVRLVYEALAERQRLRKNAPHLVKVLPVPAARVRQGGRDPQEAVAGPGQRHVDVRPDRWRPHRQAPQAHQRGRGHGPHAHPAPRGVGRLVPLLRRPGRRRPPHPRPGPHRGHRLRRRGGQRHPGRRPSARTTRAGRAEPPSRPPTATAPPGRSTSRPTRWSTPAGVWSDDVRLLDEGTHPDSIRPAKGIHITVPWSKVRNDIAVVVPVPPRQALGLRGAVGRAHLHRHHRHRLRRAHRRPAVHRPRTSPTCSGP